MPAQNNSTIEYSHYQQQLTFQILHVKEQHSQHLFSNFIVNLHTIGMYMDAVIDTNTQTYIQKSKNSSKILTNIVMKQL